MRSALAVSALVLVAGCGSGVSTREPPERTGGPRDFTVAVQANVHGDIEPCG